MGLERGPSGARMSLRLAGLPVQIPANADSRSVSARVLPAVHFPTGAQASATRTVPRADWASLLRVRWSRVLGGGHAT